MFLKISQPSYYTENLFYKNWFGYISRGAVMMMHPSTFCRDFGREIGLFCISPCSAADVVLVHMTIAPAGFVLLALLQITHNI